MIENASVDLIDPDMTSEQLESYCKEKGIPFNEGDDSLIWNAFANYYGESHGLVEIERLSFGHICSLFFAGMGVSCGTDAYFKEEIIEYAVVDMYNELQEDLEGEDLVRGLFNKIFTLYKEKASSEYAFFTEKKNVKISLGQLQRLQRLEGNSLSEKIRKLIP